MLVARGHTEKYMYAVHKHMSDEGLRMFIVACNYPLSAYINCNSFLLYGCC